VGGESIGESVVVAQPAIASATRARSTILPIDLVMDAFLLSKHFQMRSSWVGNHYNRYSVLNLQNILASQETEEPVELLFGFPE
jgi:hypothetical protein